MISGSFAFAKPPVQIAHYYTFLEVVIVTGDYSDMINRIYRIYSEHDKHSTLEIHPKPAFFDHPVNLVHRV